METAPSELANANNKGKKVAVAGNPTENGEALCNGSVENGEKSDGEEGENTEKMDTEEDGEDEEEVTQEEEEKEEEDDAGNNDDGVEEIKDEESMDADEKDGEESEVSQQGSETSPSKSNDEKAKEPAEEDVQVIEDDDDDDDDVVPLDDEDPLANTSGEVSSSSVPTDLSMKKNTPGDGKLTLVDPKSFQSSTSPPGGGPLNLSTGAKKKPMPQLNAISVHSPNQAHKPHHHTPHGPGHTSHHGGQSSGHHGHHHSSAPPPLAPVQKPSPGGVLADRTLDNDELIVEAASFVTPYVYQKPRSEKIVKIWKRLRRQELRKGEKKEGEEMEEDENEEEEEDDEVTAENEGEEKNEKDEVLEKIKKIEEMDALRKKKKKRKQNIEARKRGEPVEDEEEWVENGDQGSDDSWDSDMEVEGGGGRKSKRKTKGGKEEEESSSNKENSAKDAAADKPKPVPVQPTTSNAYFSEPIGKFLLDIGTSLVQEFVTYDVLRVQKKKLQKDAKTDPASVPPAAHQVLKAMAETLENVREKNAHLKKKSCFRCKFCPFRTSSETILEHHYETPHFVRSAPGTSVSGLSHKCNFCPFETKLSQEISEHFRLAHGRRCKPDRLECRFQCPTCPWEDNHKPKWRKHLALCEKKFRPETNCDVTGDWEPPGKVSAKGGMTGAVVNSAPNAPGTGAAPAQARPNFYQFHPLVPKEHVKAANTIIAASAKPQRPRSSGTGPGVAAGTQQAYQKTPTGISMIPRMSNLPPGIINVAATQMGQNFRGIPAAHSGSVPSTVKSVKASPAAASAANSSADPNSFHSQYQRLVWSQQQQHLSAGAACAAAMGNIAWLNSLQANGQGVAMAGGTSISLVPSGSGSSARNRSSGGSSSSVTIRPIPGGSASTSGNKPPSGSSSNSPANLGFSLPSSLTIQSLKGTAHSAKPSSSVRISASSKPSSSRSTSSGPSPSISITPLPSGVVPSASKAAVAAAAAAAASSAQKRPVGIPPAKFKPGASQGAQNPSSFVVCEICDGYIKDLEQLGNHLKWIHKVHLHPRLLQSRPPLNCQKCQFRFFTDQGLERHLLGTHGLVTSSMQDAANNNQDSGRCPICGKMYQWKLLAHVTKDHKVNLKPAHLSYKCTVCTATFGMYRSFEQHVYNEHSSLAKKQAASGKGGGGAGGSQQGQKKASVRPQGLSGPLQISDEITIIPQPKSASSSSNSSKPPPSQVTLQKVTTSQQQQPPSRRTITIDLADEEGLGELVVKKKPVPASVPFQAQAQVPAVQHQGAQGRKAKMMPPMKRRLPQEPSQGEDKRPRN